MNFKKLFYNLVLIFTLFFTANTQAASKIKSVIYQYQNQNTKIGLAVYSLKSDKTIFSYNENRLFVPASNVKLVTTIAALKLLGPNYYYKTKFGTDDYSKGVAKNLYIKASGDPALSHKQVTWIARQLKSRGLEKIEGQIIIDDSIFKTQNLVPESTHYYHAIPSGFAINNNIYEIKSSKYRPYLIVSPRSNYLKYYQFKKTGGRNILLSRQFIKDHEQLKIISPRKDTTLQVSVINPIYFAGETLKASLNHLGINTDHVKIKRGKYNAKKSILKYKHKPLKETILLINKESNNFAAEMLLLKLGSVLKNSGDTLSGAKVLKEFLVENGFSQKDFRIFNGSGLSRKNKLTPAFLVKLLLKASNDNQIWPILKSSLSISGIDGTLKDKFLKSPFKGSLRAKTGTLSNVSSLTGVLPTQNGDVLLFSLLVNGPGANAGRYFPLQQRILTLLYKNKYK